MPEPLPAWARAVVEPGERLASPEAGLDLAVELAAASARSGGGPFGAVIADADLAVVAAGFNHVVQGRDSTAHAEVHAIRRAQARLGTHDLAEPGRAPLTLLASCEPCVMCFGAVYWSGLARVLAAAASGEAEALGFQEGPVTDAMWARAREEKGISYEAGRSGERDPTEPFAVYRERGGEIY